MFLYSINKKVIPVNQAGTPIGEIAFTRTGLLGFVGPVRIYSHLPKLHLHRAGLGLRVLPMHLSSRFSVDTLQGSLVFVVGKIEGLLMVSKRRHNADDLVATALAVEPVKTVYRGR